MSRKPPTKAIAKLSDYERQRLYTSLGLDHLDGILGLIPKSERERYIHAWVAPSEKIYFPTRDDAIAFAQGLSKEQFSPHISKTRTIPGTDIEVTPTSELIESFPGFFLFHCEKDTATAH